PLKYISIFIYLKQYSYTSVLQILEKENVGRPDYANLYNNATPNLDQPKNISGSTRIARHI
uniref:Uncharacterized protein n=2 Tax=Aegilops tauschii subsp. strangulata TaxID=200361 RepID=A0A453ESC4_AEGTS